MRATKILIGNDLDKMVRMLYEPSLEDRKKISTDFIDEEVIKTLDSNNKLTMSRFSAPWPVYPREFLTLKTKRMLADDVYIVAAQSINYKSKPFSNKYVRAVVRTGMFIEKMDNNRIKITRVEHIDSKGFIPLWIIDMKKGKVGERLTNMQVYLDE